MAGNIQGLPSIGDWTPPWGVNAPQPAPKTWVPYDPGAAPLGSEEPPPEEG